MSEQSEKPRDHNKQPNKTKQAWQCETHKLRTRLDRELNREHSLHVFSNGERLLPGDHCLGPRRGCSPGVDVRQLGAGEVARAASASRLG